MPRKTATLDDLDFQIYVDPSCLSAPTPEEPPHKSVEDNGEDENTFQPAYSADFDGDDEASELGSRRQSTKSNRKTSLRTEALIQAAARAVVSRIEKEDTRKQVVGEEDLGDHSILSNTADDMSEHGDTQHPDEEASGDARRDSTGSSQDLHQSGHTSEADTGGENSSHHGGDDDVFSDRSPRTSLGSLDSGAEDARRKSEATVHHHHADEHGEYTRSPRVSGVSGVSGISNLSQYENEDFVPTSRETPRPAFRTPSDVRAIQMSSPPPSVYGSGSPRSGKRHTGISTTSGLPTISRLGSPNVSTQYSPKGRSTPPRFKIKKEAPLVLLHATLLPLRWVWGDVVNSIDDTKGLEGYEPSEQIKSLRDAWRQLQDRIGDTVMERGILLPHPQNDYEVLEERLLEALELPLRRRARILECGHYLGPANEHSLGEDDEMDSADEEGYDGDRKRPPEKRHWCSTCRSEIKYDDLGEGRVFRVKVYASNGLMRAGAWEACWKEMERIDVELEPIVDPTLQGEVEKLARLRLEEQERMDMGEHHDEHHEEAYREMEEQQQREEQERREMEERHDEERRREEDRHHATVEEDHGDDEEQPLPTTEEELDGEEEHSYVRQSQPVESSSPPRHSSPSERRSSPILSSPRRARRNVRVEFAPDVLDDEDDERRRRDEERLREIYGHTPPRPTDEQMPSSPPSHSDASETHADEQQARSSPPEPHPEDSYAPQSSGQEGHASSAPHNESYARPPSPPSPSAEAFERREYRRHTYQTASLPELALESLRVVFQDRRNVMIALLSVLILLLAVRTAPGQQGTMTTREAEMLKDLYAMQHQLEQHEQAARAMTSAMTTTTTLSAVVEASPEPSEQPLEMLDAEMGEAAEMAEMAVLQEDQGDTLTFTDGVAEMPEVLEAVEVETATTSAPPSATLPVDDHPCAAYWAKDERAVYLNKAETSQELASSAGCGVNSSPARAAKETVIETVTQTETVRVTAADETTTETSTETSSETLAAITADATHGCIPASEAAGYGSAHTETVTETVQVTFTVSAPTPSATEAVEEEPVEVEPVEEPAATLAPEVDIDADDSDADAVEAGDADGAVTDEEDAPGPEPATITLEEAVAAQEVEKAPPTCEEMLAAAVAAAMSPAASAAAAVEGEKCEEV